MRLFLDGGKAPTGDGRQPGQFNRPRAVAVNSHGEMFTIDMTGRVQVHDIQTGEYLRHFMLLNYREGTPTGFSIDPVDDSLWIADTHYQRILQFDRFGELLFSFGEVGDEPGKFVFPTDVWPDPDGQTLWVSEYGHRDRVMKFTRDGKFEKEWGSIAYMNMDLARPMAIFLAKDGMEIIVVDAVNHRLVVFDREGNQLRTIGGPRAEDGELKYPYDASLAPDGSIYVVEYGNNRISRFDLEGKYLGSFGQAGVHPGSFFNPWGVYISPFDGSMMVADTNSHRIQVFDRPERLAWKGATANPAVMQAGGGLAP